MAFKLYIYLLVFCFLWCSCTVGGVGEKVSPAVDGVIEKVSPDVDGVIEKVSPDVGDNPLSLLRHLKDRLFPRTSSQPEAPALGATKSPGFDDSKTSAFGTNKTKFETITFAMDPYSKDFVDTHDPMRSQMTSFLRRRWPNKTIPVGFDERFPKRLRSKVYQVMDVLNKETCVKLTNVTGPDVYHVKVTNLRKSCSAVTGYHKGRERSQFANFHEVCFERQGIIFHELIHAIGFSHQHVRADRDEYVRIHEDHIKPEYLSNFLKSHGPYAFVMTLGLPYDYGSVMQYSETAFSNGKGPSLTVLKPHSATVGQRVRPSRSDIASINRLYECWDHDLGDDIRGAVPYKDFYSALMIPEPNVSTTMQRWLDEKTRESSTRTSAKYGNSNLHSWSYDKIPPLPVHVSIPSKPIENQEDNRDKSDKGFEFLLDKDKENRKSKFDLMRKEIQGTIMSLRDTDKDKMSTQVPNSPDQEFLEIRQQLSEFKAVQEKNVEEIESLRQENVQLRKELSKMKDAQEKDREEINTLRQELAELKCLCQAKEEINSSPVEKIEDSHQVIKKSDLEKSECTMVAEATGKSVPVTEEKVIDLIDHNGWEMRSRKPQELDEFVAKVNCPAMSVRPFWLMKGVCKVKVPKHLKDTTNKVSSGSLRQGKLNKLLTDGSLVKVKEKDPDAISVKCANEKFFVASRMTCKAEHRSKVYYLTDMKVNKIRMTHKHVGPDYQGKDLVIVAVWQTEVVDGSQTPMEDASATAGDMKACRQLTEMLGD
ncbi:uncharacterized protein [Panulirus ornatus]|uniref:uncharacterized protein n=1 Tax=Panulirus ornatus TaxID=150431 RepID=UPI003A8BAB58